MAPPARPCVDITVVSDTVCPWCYVGKARLGKALARFEGRLDARVRWAPFQLNPGAPAEGENKMDSYNKKFGPSRVAAMVPAMSRTFAEEGLPPYNMEGLTGNTLDSHRLLTWAADAHGLEAQNRLVDKLFEGYFTQARYIGDRSFLLEAAAAAGLPTDEAAKVLDDPQAFLGEVRSEQRAHPGVTGVPHFVIRFGGGAARLGGAQPPEEFAEIFEQILSMADEQAAAAAGKGQAAPAPAGAAAAAADGGACGLGGGAC